MERGVILDSRRMGQEIKASHKRSRQYGINRKERNHNQASLTPAALVERQRQSRDFLTVVATQIEEFYDLLSPSDFMIGVADSEGYILLMAGSDELLEKFAERNCVPGYRFTEKDVGTTAISLCLERKIPVQLNDRDHYCQRAYGFTSSAAPIFGEREELLGVLVVSGSSSLVHPHTLLMITSAAKSVEKQLHILRRNKELAMNVGFLDSIVEATGMGLMALDKELRIWRINRKGKQILKRDDLTGKPLSVLGNMGLDLEAIRKNPASWVNREYSLGDSPHDIQFLFTAQPVMSSEKEILGAVVAFEEMASIRKLVDNIAGTKAYFTFDHLIGDSPGFKQALDLAWRAAESNATVLLQGETGTGKELFAQAIHNAGPRRGKPFVPINCGAIPAELLESELFGYVEGTFTGALRGGRAGKFELANGGTMLLDEIGDMPHDMQVKLLRVLQTGEVYRIGARKPVQIDTRIIACTHVDLAQAVAQRRFREDLFYRLNVFPIRIPPLRERGVEDITKLTHFFLKRRKGATPNLTSAALEALAAHDWPGNVRELENSIQRALNLLEGEVLDVQHIGLPARPNKLAASRPGTLRDMEREVISMTLEQTGSNMAATAKKLGISRMTLYRKVKQYEIG